MGYPRNLVQERSFFDFHELEAVRQIAPALPHRPLLHPPSPPALPSKLLNSPYARPPSEQAQDAKLEEGPTFLNRPFSGKGEEEAWENYTHMIKEPMWTQARGENKEAGFGSVFGV